MEMLGVVQTLPHVESDRDGNMELELRGLLGGRRPGLQLFFSVRSKVKAIY